MIKTFLILYVFLTICFAYTLKSIKTNSGIVNGANYSAGTIVSEIRAQMKKNMTSKSYDKNNSINNDLLKVQNSKSFFRLETETGHIPQKKTINTNNLNDFQKSKNLNPVTHDATRHWESQWIPNQDLGESKNTVPDKSNTSLDYNENPIPILKPYPKKPKNRPLQKSQSNSHRGFNNSSENGYGPDEGTSYDLVTHSKQQEPPTNHKKNKSLNSPVQDSTGATGYDTYPYFDPDFYAFADDFFDGLDSY